jgi:hypothetical protein
LKQIRETGSSFRRKPESSLPQHWTPACAGVTDFIITDGASRHDRQAVLAVAERQ